MPSADPLSLGYLLGELHGTQAEHGRRLSEQTAEHRSLKSRVEKLETWGERAVILALLYGGGLGLHLTAGTLAPLAASLLRAVLGLRS